MTTRKKLKLKTILLSFLISIFLISQNTPLILALTAPEAPDKPQAPLSPQAPSAPTKPDENKEEIPKENPSSEVIPSPNPNSQTDNPISENPTPTASFQPSETNNTTPSQNAQNIEEENLNNLTSEDNSQPSQNNQNIIQTGDTTADSTIENLGNTNTQVNNPTQESNKNNLSLNNLNNGSASDNSASASTNSENNLTQNNSAEINNNLNSSTITGNNTASNNTQTNSVIETGDANTSGTIINSVNNNISSLTLAQFDIEDDHLGDFILDPNSTKTYSYDNNSLSNEGNGTSSSNSSQLEEISNNNTFQNNESSIENELILNADTGNNKADKNTGGDSIIETGNANVSANILNFANNNIEGDITYNLVNIYGDLVGDIIFPEEYYQNLESNNSNLNNLSNHNNGSDSENNITSSTEDSKYLEQVNDAIIDNNLEYSANTGSNQNSKNTGGNSLTQTGDVNLYSQTSNLANNNINLEEGNFFLVLVNELGQWVGKLFGQSENQNYLAQGLEIKPDNNGELNITNSDNGSNSSNDISTNKQSTENINQNNTAIIENNVKLSANTGNNSTSKNTNGDSFIKTGDANIISNIVNFVNNNITGKGKLYVTVINVFGNWVGDFVPPWAKKDKNITKENSNQENQNPSNTTSENTENVGIGGETANQNLNSLTEKDLISEPNNNSNNNQTKATIITRILGISNSKKITNPKNNQLNSSSNPIENNKANDLENSHSLQDNYLKKSISFETQTSSRKQIDLNLAWLLLIFPSLGSILYAVKKIFT